MAFGEYLDGGLVVKAYVSTGTSAAIFSNFQKMSENSVRWTKSGNLCKGRNQEYN
jgi:hypothetical protein